MPLTKKSIETLRDLSRPLRSTHNAIIRSYPLETPAMDRKDPDKWWPAKYDQLVAEGYVSTKKLQLSELLPDCRTVKRSCRCQLYLTQKGEDYIVQNGIK